MLVLTRKMNEQIRIGDDVTITIVRVKGNTVRIGIEAPRTTRVVRGELEPLDSQREAGVKPTAAPRSAAAARALSGPAPTSDADDQSASPLAAYMPSRISCLASEMSA